MNARTRLSMAAIVVLTVLASACGDDAARESDALRGRTFLSESVTVGGEAKALVAGTRIRLSFPSEDRITATVGCNILSGTMSIGDDRLVITDLGSTEMGCDPARHAQDEWLASVLSAWPSYQLDDTHLVLETEDTVVQLLDREVADPDRPLTQTTWAVDGLITGTTASSIPAGTAATVTFGAVEVHVSVASCNEGTAKVQIGQSTIRFEPFVMTDVACTPLSSQLQTAILAVLNGNVTYSIEAASLRVTRSDGNGLTLRAA